MTVPQIKELLEVPHMLADINHLKTGIAFNLLLYELAVRAGFHYEHLYLGQLNIMTKIAILRETAYFPRNSVGVIPVTFLKSLVKWCGNSNPSR